MALVITRQPVGESVVIGLAGELDIASVPVLERYLDDLAISGGPPVVIDLGDLDFLDSAGLHMLLRARERLAERGRVLRLRPGRAAVQRVFELTRTAERFQFEDRPARAAPPRK